MITMINSPMEQFNMINFFSFRILGMDWSISNLAIVCIMLVTLFYLLVTISHREFSDSTISFALVPNYYQSTLELLYELIEGLIQSNIVKDNSSRKFFVFVATIFVTVFGFNLLGLLPYVFSVTSMVSVAMTLSFTIFFGITLMGIFKYNIEFLSMFLPTGAPLWLAPLLVIIEIISYLARGFSLGIRLGANLISGHILLAVIAGFAYTMLKGLLVPFYIINPLTGAVSILWSSIVNPFTYLSNIFLLTAFIACFSLVFILFFLEIMVSFIQAFVISLLLCIYIGDIKNLLSH